MEEPKPLGRALVPEPGTPDELQRISAIGGQSEGVTQDSIEVILLVGLGSLLNHESRQELIPLLSHGHSSFVARAWHFT